METRLEAYYKTHQEAFDIITDWKDLIESVYTEQGFIRREDYMVEDLIRFLQKSSTYKRYTFTRFLNKLKKFVNEIVYNLKFWYRGKTLKSADYVRKATVESYSKTL